MGIYVDANEPELRVVCALAVAGDVAQEREHAPFGIFRGIFGIAFYAFLLTAASKTFLGGGGGTFQIFGKRARWVSC